MSKTGKGWGQISLWGTTCEVTCAYGKPLPIVGYAAYPAFVLFALAAGGKGDSAAAATGRWAVADP